jgi:methionyl aminopeptidase
MSTVAAETPESTKPQQQQQGAAASPETSQDAPKADGAVHKCAAEGCSSDAKMQCPTCVKVGAPATHFCSQDCFKKAWGKHAQSHTRFQRAQEFVPPKYRYTGPLRPSFVTPRAVPPAVPRPDYALTGNPVSEDQSKFQRVAPVFTADQIELIRQASRIGREALDLAAHMCVPGALPDDIDRAVHNYIVGKGGYPSPLNYRGFPKSVCISVNEVVCHGIPDMRPLQDGDIVNIDVTAYYKGTYASFSGYYSFRSFFFLICLCLGI